jgi:uncharacterized protein
MILDIRAIPSGFSRITRDVELSEQQARESGLRGAAHCMAELNRTGTRIFVRVQYRCAVRRQCSRCLKLYEQQVDSSYEVILQQVSDADASGAPDDDDRYFFSEEDKQLDVRQALYDDIMINIPIKPLCSAQCPGIQRSDGGERDEEIDPRWEALVRLKRKNT